MANKREGNITTVPKKDLYCCKESKTPRSTSIRNGSIEVIF